MFKRKLIRIPLTILTIVMILGAFFMVGPGKAQPAEAQPAANIIYNFYATDGYIQMADGTLLYNYGFVGGREGQPLTYQNSWVKPPTAAATFVPGGNVTVAGGAPAPTAGPTTATELQFAGNAQFPAPLIYCTTNDVVEIRLKNLGVTVRGVPNDPHTIHLHGVDVDAANDGVPETSLATIPANSILPGAGNVVVYMFRATHPGTYMYHCHQEADIHVTMGMYGALVVYNPTDAARVNGPGSGTGNLFGFNYTKDYVMMLTDTDIGQHISELKGGRKAGGFNPVNYKPQYWFINGLSFPNTVHAGLPGFVYTNWLAAHKGYETLLTGSVGAADKVLVRMINLGFETQPMHVHGFHPKVIGSDQRAWPWANTAATPFGQGLEKNTITIGSGETYELLFDFSQQSLFSTYQAGSQSRYNPVGNIPLSNTQTNFPAIPDPFALGKAYIGGPRVGPDSQTSQGPAGLPAELPYIPGQYFPFHNHDDYKATNNGVYPGGMFTLVQTLP